MHCHRAANKTGEEAGEERNAGHVDIKGRQTKGRLLQVTPCVDIPGPPTVCPISEALFSHGEKCAAELRVLEISKS